MNNLELITLFSINSLVVFTVYFLFLRHKHVVYKKVNFILALIFISSPLYIAVGGVQSAIYIHDFLLAYIVFVFIRNKRIYRFKITKQVCLLLILLIIIPFFSYIMSLVFVREDIPSLGREILGLTTFLYRNTLLIILFAFGISAKLNTDGMISFVKANMYISTSIIMLGLINYFKLYDLVVMEKIIAQNEYFRVKAISESRVGLGYLGMMRPTVGHWFAVIAVLLTGCLSILPKKYLIPALLVIAGSILIIFFSYSRAGLIGAALGLCSIALFGGKLSQRITVVITALIAVLLAYYNFDTIGTRLLSITDISSGTSAGRIGVWYTSLSYFFDNFLVFIFGVGATSRDIVFAVTGAYGAHNEYIDSIWRAGFFMTVFLLLTLYNLYRLFSKGRKYHEKNAKMFSSCAASILIVGITIGLSQNHLLIDYSNYTLAAYLYFVYGIFAGYILNLKKTTGVNSKSVVGDNSK